MHTMSIIIKVKPLDADIVFCISDSIDDEMRQAILDKYDKKISSNADNATLYVTNSENMGFVYIHENYVKSFEKHALLVVEHMLEDIHYDKKSKMKKALLGRLALTVKAELDDHGFFSNGNVQQFSAADLVRSFNES